MTGNDIRNGLNYMHVAALSIGDQDMRFFELLGQVPIVHNIPSYIICAVNIILPGIGTIIAVVVADRYISNKTQLLVGLF